MIQLLTIDPTLADAVDTELHSAKPNWKYYKQTISDEENEYYSKYYDQIGKQFLINDAQRFTDIIYSDLEFDQVGFYSIRKNPDSRYNRRFPNTAKLIDYIQFDSGTIPNNFKVKRIYINLQTIRPSWQLNRPHFDSEDNSISVLYYVNNSDGDTYFFKDDALIHQASPVKGTAVVFPSKTLHAGSVPIKNETRTVINIVFMPV